MQYVPELIARMKRIKSITDVTSDLNNDGLSVDVEVNRQLAARYGITPATIDNALYDALGQRIVSTIFNQSNQYRVVLVAKPESLPTVESLGDLYLPTQTGSTGQVPLSGIADIKITKSPLVISHLAQFPAVTVSFNLAKDASLSTAVDEIKQAEQAVHLPPSITTSFQGAAQAFQDSLSSEVFLLMAALVTVYIVLGVLYESYIHPVTILSTLPSAGIGALLALMIAGSDLDVIGIIGIVLLIGIVKKNGIMIVDFALEAERKHGKAPEEAIFEASMLRFRPILMTTLAAMLGALPLLRGHAAPARSCAGRWDSPSSAAWLVSQMLTLFTTPVIYLLFDRLVAALPAQGPPRRLPGRRRMNIPVALHQSTGGDHTARDRHRAVGPAGVFPSAGRTAAERHLSGHRGAGEPWRARAPNIMASTVAEPLERRLATIAGVTELTSTKFGRHIAGRRPVRHEPRHQRRGARRRGSDPGRARRPADDTAQQSHLSRIQPGGFAHHHPGADLEDADAGAALRLGRLGHPAAALADQSAWDRSRSAAARCPRCASNSSPTS